MSGTLPEPIGMGQSFAPLAPSPYHIWDRDARTWVARVDLAIAARCDDVDVERARRHAAPIDYATARFDADAEARENITGVLLRLLRGDGLPADWIGWRDADNAMHWVADDAATVQVELAALSRAIEDRKQALLIAAWTHKAALAALGTVEAVLAYDLSSGWPA